LGSNYPHLAIGEEKLNLKMIIILNAEQININNFILEIYDLNGNLIKKDVLYG